MRDVSSFCRLYLEALYFLYNVFAIVSHYAYWSSASSNMSSDSSPAHGLVAVVDARISTFPSECSKFLQN